jgi:hypothetical protein
MSVSGARIFGEKTFLDSKTGINDMLFDKTRVEGHKIRECVILNYIKTHISKT